MDTITDITHTIQLAVAPVFLLAGIGALMTVVTSRLGRAVDRARILEERLASGVCESDTQCYQKDLGVLDRRMVLSQRAITLTCLSALLVCILVAALFIGNLLALDADGVIAVLFIAAMAVLIGGLSFFLAEVTIATRMLRVRAELIIKE